MIYFIITLIFFSSIEVVSKDLMNYIGPFEMTFMRFLIGAAGLLVFSFINGAYREFSKLKKNDYFLMAILGFINIFFSMTMLQYAIKYGSPQVVALIISSNPIFVYLISVALKNDRFTLRHAAGFVLGITGLFFVIIQDISNIELEKGSLFALAGAFSFAFFTILNKKAVAEHRPIIVNIVTFCFGVIFILIYLALKGSVDIAPGTFASVNRIMTILYLGIFVTAVSYITFLSAIKQMGPVASSLVFMFKPSVATVFAVIFLSAELTPAFFAGLLLTAAGSRMIMKKPKTGAVNA